MKFMTINQKFDFFELSYKFLTENKNRNQEEVNLFELA